MNSFLNLVLVTIVSFLSSTMHLYVTIDDYLISLFVTAKFCISIFNRLYCQHTYFNMSCVLASYMNLANSKYSRLDIADSNSGLFCLPCH